MSNLVYKVEHLSKTYRSGGREVVALEDVSIEVESGSVVGIIGHSGAGKSTLLRCLNRLEEPDSGSIEYGGENLLTAGEEGLKKMRSDMGMIFQHFNLLSRRTALENVMLPLEIAGVCDGECERRAMDALKIVGLADFVDAYPGQLSGGQKQRVGIARAIAADTHVLLCDEATSALDPVATDEVLCCLKKLRRELGLTIVLITHEISVVRNICDKVYVMDAAKVVEAASAEEIFSAPKHPVTQRFIGELVQSNIPEVVRTCMSEEPTGKAGEEVLVRIMFQGEKAQEPVISEMVKKFDTSVNIMAGYIDQIGETAFGTLIVSFPNNAEVVKRKTEYLEQQQVRSQIVGYIERC